ncbi:unnamed protein product [Gordionus sp. m RMFG-2023]
MGLQDQIYCICRKSYDGSSFMIECDSCKEWFHGRCVEIDEAQAAVMDNYICPNCKRIHGSPRCDADVFREIYKAGTPKFIKMIKSKKFLSSKTIMWYMTGQELNMSHFVSHGFNNPIFVEKKENIGLKLPPHDFNVNDLMRYIDRDKMIDVIDVHNQTEIKMRLKKWLKYYTNPVRDKIYNVISLEVTDTDLGKMIKVPRIVRRLSWVELYWPRPPPHSHINVPDNLNSTSIYYGNSSHSCDKNLTHNRFKSDSYQPYNTYDSLSATLKNHLFSNEVSADDKKEDEFEGKDNMAEIEYLYPPCVEKYCLMSVRDSYTDFHIDFGGSSVWYHVLRGEKIFYLIPPSPQNLQLYEEWSQLSDQTQVFFGDMVENVYQCTIKQGQTLFLPSGWIHAVLTPIDSLVFGGNFLHSFNASQQLSIYEIESRLKTAYRFMFPYFDLMCWLAAKNLTKKLNEFTDTDDSPPPIYLVRGTHFLLQKLKLWEKTTEPKFVLPNYINTTNILNEMALSLQNIKIAHDFDYIDDAYTENINYILDSRFQREPFSDKSDFEPNVAIEPAEKLNISFPINSHSKSRDEDTKNLVESKNTQNIRSPIKKLKIKKITYFENDGVKLETLFYTIGYSSEGK